MAIHAIFMLFALLPQQLGSPKAPPRIFQSSPLHWTAPPATLHMNFLKASAQLRFFYEDGRFVSLGAELEKRKGAVNAIILLTEGFAMRFGTWQKQGTGFSSHSIYGYLPVKVNPEPGPVDESYASRVDLFTSSRLLAKEAREGKLVLVPAAHTTNLEDVRRSIEADICSVVQLSPSSDSAWSAFCAQQAKANPSKP